MLRKIGFQFCLCLLPLVSFGAPAVGQQEIKAPDGSLFMEEVPQKHPARPAPPVRPIDLSGLGVPTTPSGRIVPLIQNEPGGVMPLGSNLSIYGEMPVWTPYGGTQYLQTPYGAPPPFYGGGYQNPYTAQGFGPHYGQGYNPYNQPYFNPAYLPYASSYSPYYNGYSPYMGSGLNLRLGRSNVYLGQAPMMPPPLGYAPTMYSSNGIGSYNFSSSYRSRGGAFGNGALGTGAFGNNYSYRSGGMLNSLLGY